MRARAILEPYSFAKSNESNRDNNNKGKKQRLNLLRDGSKGKVNNLTTTNDKEISNSDIKNIG